MINSFSGEYEFLSNFYPCEVEYGGMIFPSSEHAYQAAKTKDMHVRGMFLGGTAGQAKRLGQSLDLREDWEGVKLLIMASILRHKFERSPELRDKLLATGKEDLEEGNYWGDRYWGVCGGTGKNWLGILLMALRCELSLHYASTSLK